MTDTTVTLAAPPSPAEPGDRPKRADARRNYDRLLAVARTAFGERGTDASLEDIARRAGVGIGTLYRHFPNRQALVLAVVRDRIEGLRHRAAELLAAESAAEGLITWMREYQEHTTCFRGLADSMAETVRCDAGMMPLCDRMMAACGALLRRAQQAGVIRADVDVPDLFTVMNAVAWAAEKSPERAERAQSVMLAGLRP